MSKTKNDYRDYEEKCGKIRKENIALLNEFADNLKAKGLNDKTIDRHCNNLEFFLNHFLLYEDAEPAEAGVYNIGMFLGYWFIRKAVWASQASIKSNAASLKKFYAFMLEKGKVDQEDFDLVKETIKQEMQDWLDTVKRYDDPDIEDMKDVWDL